MSAVSSITAAATLWALWFVAHDRTRPPPAAPQAIDHETLLEIRDLLRRLEDPGSTSTGDPRSPEDAATDLERLPARSPELAEVRAEIGKFRAELGRIARGIEALRPSSGPLGSDQDVRMLVDLPRTPTDQAAVTRWLRGWPKSTQELLYVRAIDVARRFGMPTETGVDGAFLTWTYKSDQTLEDHPEMLVLHMHRNLIVQVKAMDLR